MSGHITTNADSSLNILFGERPEFDSFGQVAFISACFTVISAIILGTALRTVSRPDRSGREQCSYELCTDYVEYLLHRPLHGQGLESSLVNSQSRPAGKTAVYQ